MQDLRGDDILATLLSELLGRLLTPRSASDLDLDAEPRQRCEVGGVTAHDTIAVPLSMLEAGPGRSALAAARA
ncbi:MAG: hypothetical protein JXQ29_06580 [Planctomycetes bacterium]|nr:hypothetical protein [Planctomycetota bacterium]